MSSVSHPPAVGPFPNPLDAAAVSERIAWLRAEYEGSDTPRIRAILLHEIAVLEELLGDEAAAARDQLSAVNTEPEFCEPLERLIAIMERRQRQSHRNLGKLLERLERVAQTPDERARAQGLRASYQLEHENDPIRARETLERAVELRPDDSALWLLLEVVAGKLGEGALRARALSARARLTEHPTWRALLLIDSADAELGQGRSELAIAALDSAIESAGAASFIGLLALEQLGTRIEREDLRARALEAQAKLILSAIEDRAHGDAQGVPHYRRTAAYAADAFLRAADAHQRRGDWAAATALLDQALARMPEELAVLYARLSAAERAGDTETAARLAQTALVRGAKGASAAALYLRLAEAAAARGDGATALSAVNFALDQDPSSIPARALQLDLLSGGHDSTALAAALEAAAEKLDTDEARARFYLLAAETWARLCHDVPGAKAALSQANLYGAPPSLVARIARMLAALTREAGWYEEATRRLLATGATDAEQSGLWFELFRARLLRGDPSGADQALSALSNTRAGAWLGHMLTAYARPFAPQPAGANAVSPRRSSVPPSPVPDAAHALRQLSELETDPAFSRTLRKIVALHALIENRHDVAREELAKLHAQDPSDALSAGALFQLLRETGEDVHAASVLQSCARATTEASLAAAFELASGILFWQSGERALGLAAFEAAAERSEPLGAELLAWALRAHEPDSLESRRHALEWLSQGDDGPAWALERFALEIGRDGDALRAAEALDQVCRADADIGMAGRLARALWSSPQSDDLDSRLAALEVLAHCGPSAAAMARAAAYQLRLAQAAGGQPDAAELEASALAWAAADDSAAAALEWLAQAMQTSNVVSEVRARRALAERLDPEARDAVLSSASLIAMLGREPSLAPLPSESAQARLASLELALPGSDPRRRAGALLAAESSFGEEHGPLVRALAGWNQLAASDVPGALASFRAVVEAYPDEVIGWEGLRAASELAGDRVAFAEACAALGDAVSDDDHGAELWERAAFVLLDELGDNQRGEYALARAVARDVRRFKSFDRLFRLVRSRRDGPRLLELIGQRLDVADDPEEIAKLFWERARVLRESGDRDGALSALENVTFLEPDHVGALALSGEIYISTGQFAEGAATLARLTALETAPAKQRLLSGVAAVDLYENKLDDVGKALEVLMGLYRSGLSTLAVRERLVRAAAKAGAWSEATQVLEKLMHERESREGRIEAARLAMAIYRDRLDDVQSALDAAEQLLQESPEDAEALDLLLSESSPTSATRQLLNRAREVLLASLASDPLDPERVDRLSRVATRLENAPLRQAALGVLVALGERTQDIDAELQMLDKRVAHLPQIAIDERALPELCDAEDTGPIADLMRELAPTLAAALGPNLASFGVTRKDRVDPRAGLPLRNEVAAWAGALGVVEFELYIGGREAQGVYGIATEVPALILGPVLTAPLSPPHRQAIARELFAIRRGTTILRHRDSTDVSALVIAACRVAGFNPPSPEYAMLAEFQRAIGKELPRRLRKVLPELAARVVSVGGDPAAWTRAAVSSLDRMAAVAAGDVSWVLAGGDAAQRGQTVVGRDALDRARRLLGFVLSPTYLNLREKLGMGVR